MTSLPATPPRPTSPPSPTPSGWGTTVGIVPDE